MAVLTSDLIETTKRHLLSGQRPMMNKLAGPSIISATSLTFQYDMTGIKEGSYLQVDLEVFYVWSVNVGAKTAVVEPAQEGSLPAAHNQGDIVVVNPRFPDHAVLAALNDCISSLSSPALGLYQIRTTDLTYVTTAGGYDFATVDLFDIVDIRARRGDATSKDWQSLNNWQIDRHGNTSNFPSGTALYLSEAADNGTAVRVEYRAGFGSLTSRSDNVQTVTGLPVTALDIPPMGAAIRLVHPREIKRNQTESQGDGRRAGEVTPGAVAGSVNALERDYYRRISEEAARLSAANPPSGYIPSAGPYTTARIGARYGVWDPS
jgi:hypothetical protein